MGIPVARRIGRRVARPERGRAPQGPALGATCRGATMNRSAYELTHGRRLRTLRGGRARLTAIVAAAAMATLLGASPGRADCFNDLQGADDEPGQKDMSQFCVVGTCNVSNNEVS